jgi:hypothetical protein
MEGASRRNAAMNRSFGQDRNFDIGQSSVDEEVRDGIKKELERTDLTPEDRKEYEDALAKIDETIGKEESQ